MTLHPSTTTYPGSGTYPGPDDLTGYATSVGRLTGTDVLTGQDQGGIDGAPIIYVNVAFDASLSVSPPNWTDVTPWVRGIDIRTGRQFELDDFQAGTCQILLDSNDGRFNPQRSDGPYVGYLTPLRKVRVFAAWQGTIYPLWQGFAEAWEPRYQNGGTNEVVTLRCADAFKLLGAKQLTTTALAPRRPANRIGEVLTGLPGIEFISTGDGSVWCAYKYVDAPESALGLVKDAARADLGSVFCDAQGRVRFEHRTYRSENETTDRYVFGEDESNGELSYTGAEFSYNDDKVFTEVIITASAAFDATHSELAESVPGQAEYGQRTLQLTLDIQQGPLAPPAVPDSDPDTTTAAAFAAELADRYQSASIRLDEIEVMPQTSDDHLAAVLGLVIGNRVRVLRRPPWASIAAETSIDKVTNATVLTTNGGMVNEPVFIERIEHSIRPGKWVTKYGLSPATAPQYFDVDIADIPSTSAIAQTDAATGRYGITSRSLVLDT